MSARILVVDDIESNVRLLEAKLSAEYYEVLTACDGPTALAIAASERPDIVLLDVMMPGMDGPTLLKIMRADPELRDIPVIFMTAKSDPQEVAQFRELSAIGVLAKPFDPMALGAQVRALWNSP